MLNLPPRIREGLDLLGGQKMSEDVKMKEVREIFPKNSKKVYGLAGLVKGKSPAVDKGPEDTMMTWPHLLMRLMSLFTILVIVLIVISLLFNAPLEERANPAHPTNPAKAPWYFLGLQELVSYDAFIGGVLVPTIIVIGLLLIPYIDRKPVGVGVWFGKGRWVQNILFAIFALVMVGLVIIGTYFRGEYWNFVLPWGS